MNENEYVNSENEDMGDYRRDCLDTMSIEGLIQVFDEQLVSCEKEIIFQQMKADSIKKLLEKLKS